MNYVLVFSGVRIELGLSLVAHLIFLAIYKLHSLSSLHIAENCDLELDKRGNVDKMSLETEYSENFQCFIYFIHQFVYASANNELVCYNIVKLRVCAAG